MKFLAIDFETADYGRDSACAVGLVRVEKSVITERVSFLIRPPRRHIYFTYVHGITWEDVKDEPTFEELWTEIHSRFEGVDYLVAHNASFDRGVLEGCCRAAAIEVPAIPFQCTMRLARKLWNLRPTNLPAVCRHFDIPLKHHDALSDTEACASIMINALKHRDIMEHLFVRKRSAAKISAYDDDFCTRSENIE